MTASSLDRLPTDLVEQIPSNCLNCPALLGRLGIYKMFDADVQRQKSSRNFLAGYINEALSRRRLVADVRKMVPQMQECGEGPILYPANSENPVEMCGSEIATILVNQTINEE